MMRVERGRMSYQNRHAAILIAPQQSQKTAEAINTRYRVSAIAKRYVAADR